VGLITNGSEGSRCSTVGACSFYKGSHHGDSLKAGGGVGLAGRWSGNGGCVGCTAVVAVADWSRLRTCFRWNGSLLGPQAERATPAAPIALLLTFLGE